MTKKYKISTISKSNLHDVIFGNLENITYGVEVGGFVRLMVYLSVCELVGRILLRADLFPQNKAGETIKKDFKPNLYVVSLEKALDYVAKSTGNHNYAEEKVKKTLKGRLRNGLAHLLIPTGEFIIGDNIDARTNHIKFNDEGKLWICDKKFGSDLIDSFSKLLSCFVSVENILLIVEKNNPDNISFEYAPPIH